MLILNINGPVNSGKTTVSKILGQKMPNTIFIEVDELLSDEEQASLKLDMRAGWVERLARLQSELIKYKTSQEYETVIFAYPITNNTYQKWAALSDKSTQFLNITLAPSLENCLKNRGTRTLTEWEEKRIRQMYEEGYQNREFADFIINNDNQTPEETADIIMGFVAHAQNHDLKGLK